MEGTFEGKWTRMLDAEPAGNAKPTYVRRRRVALIMAGRKLGKTTRISLRGETERYEKVGRIPTP